MQVFSAYSAASQRHLTNRSQACVLCSTLSSALRLCIFISCPSRLSIAMFAVSALLSLSFVLSAQAAFTAAQTAFFASGDALSGGNAKTRAYDAAILANSTHALITMTATGSKIGWMAMGSGPTMVGADMVRHIPLTPL